MSSPAFKIYSTARGYIGSCKFAEDAAVLVSVQGHGSTVRYFHKYIVWTEGKDGSAQESYDGAASAMNHRVAEINQKSFDQAHPRA